MLRLLLDELLLRRRGEGGAEGRGGPRGGGGREKSHLARGWILRYEPLCEVLGVVREEFSFIGVYTRGGNSFIFAHRMCRVHAHVHARAYMYTHTRATTLLSQLSSYASTTGGRARAFNDRLPRGCNPLHGCNLRVLRIPETAVRHLPPLFLLPARIPWPVSR